MKQLLVVVSVAAVLFFSCSNEKKITSASDYDASPYEVQEAAYCKIQGRKVFNDDVGFSFIMPAGAYYNFGKEIRLNNYHVEVDVIPPGDFPDGVEQFERIKNAIIAKKYPNIPFGNPAGTIEYKKINNYNVAIDMYEGFDVYDGEIGKRLAFIKNNNLVLIYFTYYFEGPRPGDFSGNEKNSDIHIEDRNNLNIVMRDIYYEYHDKFKNKNKKFGLGPYDSYYYYLEKDFRAGKLKNTLPKEVQNLILQFDEIIETLKIE